MPKAFVQATAQPEKTPEEEAQERAKKEAQVTVARFIDEYQELTHMKKQFDVSFPEASAALKDIMQQEDLVRDLISAAHPLVQAAKETVGPFVCQRKWASAGYDSKVVTQLIKDMEETAAANILITLVKDGVIETLGFSKTATAYIARNAEYNKQFEKAWQEKKEKTAAVTVPKL